MNLNAPYSLKPRGAADSGKPDAWGAAQAKAFIGGLNPASPQRSATRSGTARAWASKEGGAPFQTGTTTVVMTGGSQWGGLRLAPRQKGQ